MVTVSRGQIILEAVKEKVRLYGRRRRDIIYAHHLDKPVWIALEESGVPDSILENNFVLVGELMHQGLANVVEKPTVSCQRVWLKPWILDEIDERVKQRWVKGSNNHPYVTVCGTADGLIELENHEIPIELKTTRRNNGYPDAWFRRAEIYAWLYNAPYAILAVVNLSEAYEIDYVVNNPGYSEIAVRIMDWLRGRYPYIAKPITEWG